jgi:hypothetical protein
VQGAVHAGALSTNTDNPAGHVVTVTPCTVFCPTVSPTGTL